MTYDDIANKGLVLLGCGKMGSAMLEGWIKGGLPATSVNVIDPKPSDWLQGTGVHINSKLPEAPAIVLVAVKPQMMGAALPTLQAMGGGPTLFISVAAGTPIKHFEAVLGSDTPIIRAMPNTPAAVAQGITAIVGNKRSTTAHLDAAEALLEAIGAVVRLKSESQIDAVTGVSGSGPAYVFHLIECLAAAGEGQGLGPELAMQLAKATVAGAGALAMQAEETPSQLRVNVTSPNGTTQAGLDVLMDSEKGLPPLIRHTVAAATHRSKELARDA
ncbi:pyrroline-5-carboxylate reductase [Lentibacter sp. XHP0401]|uniref:pyrroline-5-carboxylate reductase n=1 Tax=Lentibacter sp. XHP0401 TaxID=2984334 RepID=UPI0021E95502|nr:pyrroline-5-carboxylate reductase [Lentibacter sp. XHP0401]MCV2893223.1 pyrroline-5-carboxylate reductase [Lentibacter sp. XHP0401]